MDPPDKLDGGAHNLSSSDTSCIPEDIRTDVSDWKQIQVKQIYSECRHSKKERGRGRQERDKLRGILMVGHTL